MVVTARDVSEAAGVSLSTVSRAFSGSDVVAPATREKILQSARELGYQPRQRGDHAVEFAIGGTAATTHTLGLIAPDVANPFFAAMAKAAQNRARSKGYRLLLADADESQTQEIELLDELNGNVDGIIMCSPRGATDKIQQHAKRSRIVLTNRLVDGVPSITVDEESGALKAIEHLKALGHTRIAYVGGPVFSNSEKSRAHALKRLQSDDDSIELLHLGNFQAFAAGGFSAADLVVSTGASAVIAFNDLVAMGVISRLRVRGYSVSGDISVIGFDDVLIADAASPTLTTVSMPMARIGADAVDLLLAHIENVAPLTSPPPLPVELVVRESTAPPPSSSRTARDAVP